jgi:hypothetical protein
MKREDVPYQAYLLRLWPVKAGGRVTWRASLRCVGNGEQIGFEDLEALFAYLRERVATGGDRPVAPRDLPDT